VLSSKLKSIFWNRNRTLWYTSNQYDKLCLPKRGEFVWVQENLVIWSNYYYYYDYYY